MSSNSPQITSRLHEALQFTFKLHGRDARKESNVPYVAHLLSVCALVQQDGGSEDEAIAALLHDALEDKAEQTSRAEIAALFGDHVVALIEVSIDTPPDYEGGEKPPWRQRKEAYLAHVRSTNPDLLRVTIADKVDNARAILADYLRIGDELWKRFNAGREDQLWYYENSVLAYEAAGYKGPLLEELRRLVDQIRAHAGQ
ncbi:MAG: HD domain-containing protein [Anaerolineales bacterium]|nr:HD domain-containing protein [Anaerolineales bacterium]